MNNRYKCTKENPWKLGMEKAFHPDAELIGEEFSLSIYDDDYDIWRCPNCGLEFKETVSK